MEAAGVRVEEMALLDAFPDAVFVEDAALCLGSHAIVLRPGAPSRFGEAEAITADLEARFATVARVDDGFVDGGDILVPAREVLVGLSARTIAAGAEALAGAREHPAMTADIKTKTAILICFMRPILSLHTRRRQ